MTGGGSVDPAELVNDVIYQIAALYDGQALYARSGFKPLTAPMGGTGHFSCDRFFILEL